MSEPVYNNLVEPSESENLIIDRSCNCSFHLLILVVLIVLILIVIVLLILDSYLVYKLNLFFDIATTPL